jgi:hypothetical protein
MVVISYKDYQEIRKGLGSRTDLLNDLDNKSHMAKCSITWHDVTDIPFNRRVVTTCCTSSQGKIIYRLYDKAVLKKISYCPFCTSPLDFSHVITFRDKCEVLAPLIVKAIRGFLFFVSAIEIIAITGGAVSGAVSGSLVGVMKLSIKSVLVGMKVGFWKGSKVGAVVLGPLLFLSNFDNRVSLLGFGVTAFSAVVYTGRTIGCIGLVSKMVCALPGLVVGLKAAQKIDQIIAIFRRLGGVVY